MLLLQACMRTNLLVIGLSVLIIIGLPLSKAFTAPTPLERATELVKSHQPEEALEVLSIYHLLREEFSGYHDVYAQALVQLNKRFDSIEQYCLATCVRDRKRVKKNYCWNGRKYTPLCSFFKNMERGAT
jgi:hypothetical protein